MFNRKTKSIKRIPKKDEGVKIIGKEIDGKVITNIEHNGQIRVLDDAKKINKWRNSIPKLKRRYLEIGLKFHPGKLLDNHNSAELYEQLAEEGLIEYG